MRTFFAVTILGLCLVLCTGTASAQATAQQTVTMNVNAVQLIAVSGNPGALTLATIAAAGDSVYTPTTDASTTYSITQNVGVSRITAQIDQNMPAMLALEVQLASARGTSAGLVDISSAAAAQDVVTAIARGADQNQTITYRFSGSTGAGTFTNLQRVVTLTLTSP